MQVFQFLLTNLANALMVAIGCLITARCFEKRSHYWFRVAFSVLIVSAWMLVTREIETSFFYGQMLLTGTVRFAVMFLMYGLSVAFWCKASFCQALFAITVSYSLQNLCERLAEVPRLFFPLYLSPLAERCLMCVLAGCVLAVYARGCRRYTHERCLVDFSKASNRMMLFLGFGTVAITVWLDLVMRVGIIKSGDWTLLAGLDVMAALYSLLTVIVSMSHLRETDSEHRAAVSAELLKKEQRRYEQDRQIHEAINVKCHDIRHQIAALGDQAYRGELKKIEKMVDIYDTELHTHNSALDVILSGKMLACMNQKITFTCMADGRRIGFMEDCDIYALFGNILDNAIEAVGNVESPDEKVITLNVATQGELLRIEQSNYFSGSLVFDDGLPITSKEDTAHHGFGTRSIRMLTEKYHGHFHIGIHDNIFSLSIIIPIAEA